MAWLLAAIVGFIPLIVQKIIKLLGISLITYVGLDFLLDTLFDYINSNYNNLSTDMLAIFELGGGHTAMKMIMSTYAGILAFKTIQKSTDITIGSKR